MKRVVVSYINLTVTYEQNIYIPCIAYFILVRFSYILTIKKRVELGTF